MIVTEAQAATPASEWPEMVASPNIFVCQARTFSVRQRYRAEVGASLFANYLTALYAPSAPGEAAGRRNTFGSAGGRPGWNSGCSGREIGEGLRHCGRFN